MVWYNPLIYHSVTQINKCQTNTKITLSLSKGHLFTYHWM
uniref:Uncharacterized protein n=1 Tax=Rhizophora mucronata TaxID=61149 RepID=A0A2P2P4R8_RHIMU